MAKVELRAAVTAGSAARGKGREGNSSDGYAFRELTRISCNGGAGRRATDFPTSGFFKTNRVGRLDGQVNLNRLCPY